MRIVRTRDYEDMSRKAANVISAQIILKPNCILGLATGSTPIGTYTQLAEWNKKGDFGLLASFYVQPRRVSWALS